MYITVSLLPNLQLLVVCRPFCDRLLVFSVALDVGEEVTAELANRV